MPHRTVFEPRVLEKITLGRGHNLIPHLRNDIIPDMLALTGQTNPNLLRNRHIVIVIDALIRRLVTRRAV